MSVLTVLNDGFIAAPPGESGCAYSNVYSNAYSNVYGCAVAEPPAPDPAELAAKVDSLLQMATAGQLTLSRRCKDWMELTRGDDFTGGRAIEFPFVGTDPPPESIAVMTVRDKITDEEVARFETSDLQGSDGSYRAVFELKSFLSGVPAREYDFDCEYRPTNGDKETIANGTLDLDGDQTRS